MVYPTNVLHFGTECSNKNHSATFPSALPEWFIKLFSKEGDLILDPFLGSGTTAVAAKMLNRHYIGIEILPEYVALAEKSVLSPPRRGSENNGRYHPPTDSTIRE
jgi:DNA modification methylase